MERIDRDKSLSTIKIKRIWFGDIESGDTSAEWRRLGLIGVVNSAICCQSLFIKLSKWSLLFQFDFIHRNGAFTETCS
jgi:hypothetical protein